MEAIQIDHFDGPGVMKLVAAPTPISAPDQVAEARRELEGRRTTGKLILSRAAHV
jgi:hypothetical protein